jgi:hypothetical protein
MNHAAFENLEQFWLEPQHARLIDAKVVRFCFAFTTSIALMEYTVYSRRLAVLGIYLATWFKLGKDAFLNALAGAPVDTILDFHESMRKIGTDRGLVLFLSKQIPCSCLEEDKNNAKHAPKTGRCTYCNSEGPKLELKKCSQCKLAQYCSKECQVVDWRAGHKKDCEMWKLSREQNATLKAQTRR